MPPAPANFAVPDHFGQHSFASGLLMGKMNALRPVVARCEGGSEAAVCHLARPEDLPWQPGIEWNRAAFLRNNKPIFQQLYRDFKRID